MDKSQVQSNLDEYRSSKFLIDLLDSTINECKLTGYFKLNCFNIPVDNQYDFIKLFSIDTFLETQQHSIFRKQLLRCLDKLIPRSLNGIILIKFISEIFSNQSLLPLEKIKMDDIKLLSDVDFLQTFKMIAELKNLPEDYIKKTILYEVAQDFNYEVFQQLTLNMEDFKAEIRGNWMRRTGELRDEIDRLNKLNQSLIKDINTKMPTKYYCQCLLKEMDKLNNGLTILVTQAFTYGNKFMKKTANQTKRTMKKIVKMIQMKMRNIEIEEENAYEEREKCEKDGTIWYPKIMEIINSNEKYKKLFERVPLEMQPSIMSNLVFELPTLNKYEEMEKELENRIESTYNKTINSIGEMDNEWEEIEEEMSKDEHEIIGKLLENSTLNESKISKKNSQNG